MVGRKFGLNRDVLSEINAWLIGEESRRHKRWFRLECLSELEESVEYEHEIYEWERGRIYRSHFRPTGEFRPMGDHLPRPTTRSRKVLGRKWQFMYLAGYIVTPVFLEKSDWETTLDYHRRHFHKLDCPFCQLRNGCMPRCPKTGKKKNVFSPKFMKIFHRHSRSS